MINQTAVIVNDPLHEDATQEPDWHTEEEYSTNTSRDDILMGSANNGREYDPLHTGIMLNPTLCSYGHDVRNTM